MNPYSRQRGVSQVQMFANYYEQISFAMLFFWSVPFHLLTHLLSASGLCISNCSHRKQLRHLSDHFGIASPVRWFSGSYTSLGLPYSRAKATTAYSPLISTVCSNAFGELRDIRGLIVYGRMPSVSLCASPPVSCCR